MPLSPQLARFNRRFTHRLFRHIAGWAPGFALLGCDELYLRSLNADTPLFVCAQTKRPDEGGGQNQVAVFTVDGIITIVDMRPDGVEECFGARPFASRFSGTLKVVVNCRAEGTGNGNDRVPIYRDTGIPAEPVR